MKIMIIKIICGILVAAILFMCGMMLANIWDNAQAEKYYSPYCYVCPIGTRELLKRTDTTVTADFLNVRCFPSEESRVGNVLKEGEGVTCVAVYEDWVLITRANSCFIIGWVKDDYINYDTSLLPDDATIDWGDIR